MYIYKKSERIAKALHMVCPAFKDCRPLRERIERLSVELVDASILPPVEAKDRLGKHLLSLSSTLEMGKSGGFLSPMNADLIQREAHHLLQEIAAYEEPRLSLPETPSIARIAKDANADRNTLSPAVPAPRPASQGHAKGQELAQPKNGRKEVILSILRSKGPSYIKDISVLIRDVSEKTIQRELQNLVLEGSVTRKGDRRWTTYALSDRAAGATGAALP